MNLELDEMIPVPAAAEKNTKSATAVMNKKVPAWLWALLSGALLLFSFPKFPLGFLAWFALIPLLKAINSAAGRRKSVFYGFLTGLVFYGFSLSWMNQVTAFGWFFLVLLETSFLMLFSWLVYEGKAIQNVFLKSLWIALAWTSVEFIRSEIPIFGMGWNLLAYSQSDYLALIQSADIWGAYGLGFAIAFVNASLFEAASKRAKSARHLLMNLLPAFFLFLILTLYGFVQLTLPVHSSIKNLKVSLIQGNIPQDVKWEPAARNKIIEIYLNLSELASYDHPDLIIWPEASFPGYFNRDSEREKIFEWVRKKSIPTIVGSPHYEDWEIAYNSAYFLDEDAQIQGRYDKLYLVPFGEYVPLKAVFGFLEPLAYSLGVSDFSSGDEYTLFNLKNGLSFSVLICFEDVFPVLARRFVKQGAEFLVVITNDAWFGNSSAPYQHLQASIFRAIENGVPVFRAANTGLSGFISKEGKVLDRVRNEQGNDIFVTGKSTLELPITTEKTFYTRFGYLFPYAALILFGTMATMKKMQRNREARNKKNAKKPVFLFLASLLLTSCFLFSSCVRFSGGTGYWYKGVDDEEVKGKQIGFDTQKMLDPNYTPGSVST